MKLGFEFSRLLPDPQGLLQGGGKQLRYVGLAAGDRLPIDSITDLIAASLVIGGRRNRR